MSIHTHAFHRGSAHGSCSASFGGSKNDYQDAIMRAADTNGDGRLSRCEKKDFFRSADSNRDGKVSGEEMLRALLNGGGKGSCGGGAGNGMGSGDASGCSGKGPSPYSPSRHADLPGRPGRPPNPSGCSGADKPHHHHCGDNANRLDANRDGRLGIGELENFMNGGAKGDCAQNGSMDRNGDGCLSLREFMKGLQIRA